MEIICLMAAANDTNTLIDIHKGHIDGCILAHSANLIFAEKLAALGAQVRIPTTINAISVDRENWLSQMILKILETKQVSLLMPMSKWVQNLFLHALPTY